MKNDPNSPKLHGFFAGKDKRFEAVRFKGFEPSFMCFLGTFHSREWCFVGNVGMFFGA